MEKLDSIQFNGLPFAFLLGVDPVHPFLILVPPPLQIVEHWLKRRERIPLHPFLILVHPLLMPVNPPLTSPSPKIEFQGYFTRKLNIYDIHI